MAGVLGIPELNQLARTPGLPSTWHDVRCDRTGQVLYWRREHTGYEVHPAYGQFRVELDGQPIGELEPNLTQAIVACREHMHEHGNYPGEHWQKRSTNAATAAGE